MKFNIDHRKLFDKYVTYKACSWDEVKSHTVSSKQLNALLTLPKMSLWYHQLPCDDGLFDTDGPTHKDVILTTEYLVRITGKHGLDEYYYVNTEGYDYARYACKIRFAKPTDEFVLERYFQGLYMPVP